MALHYVKNNIQFYFIMFLIFKQQRCENFNCPQNCECIDENSVNNFKLKIIYV